MNITISQGRTAPPSGAHITIVIDVIRAFTVAHYAFIQGVDRIYLADSKEQAFQIKEKYPEYLLAGEVEGYSIDGFNLDNSPYHLKKHNLKNKTLVQKTTNGVHATLNCLDCDHVFVTGFTNAKRTATYVKEQVNSDTWIHIVASHPSGDDDLACAEYIKGIIEESSYIKEQEVIKRVKGSHVAEKFFDENKEVFMPEDIDYCLADINSNFVMKVSKQGELPMIERVIE
ncbi:2-phosphosulfolactate phosphatase [Aquibacillus kalidii]|uniref:2-phosphosulfolactate phosphatase n=1 Tax=Aquibacillus kalidii TaxID=2762597 RepID=UPI001647A68E|nr:2-phosphosulfolactate phosphatase [Aquibacillus kalidii]